MCRAEYSSVSLVKLTPLVFGLILLVRRDWKGIITLGATFLATIALGFVLLPQEAPQYWFHAVSDPSRVGDINFVDNISIQGWLMHYGLSGTAAKLGFYLLAALSVVLTAAISVYNSAIYSNSRMLYGLAQRGDAPSVLKSLSARGVPVLGILISSGITLIVVFLNYFFPGDAFLYLISIATCAAVISWVTIVVTHLKFRTQMERAGKHIKFRAPFYPWINYLCIVFLIGVVVMMAQIPGMQLAVPILPAWLLVLWLGYRSKKRREKE